MMARRKEIGTGKETTGKETKTEIEAMKGIVEEIGEGGTVIEKIETGTDDGNLEWSAEDMTEIVGLIIGKEMNVQCEAH